MTGVRWTIRELRGALANGELRPRALAEAALARGNGNAGRNTYLWQDRAWTLTEAARAEAIPRGEGGPFGDGRDALWGLPISVKDCFDLAGAPTSCGVRFYRDLNGAATKDSWLGERLRAAGAVIMGKTHLHPLAYGITGENPEFGDCVQPGKEGALTGGSSSGAAASVLEGSAVAAIGTDTGGSIRAPAALCGLVGYRASIGRGDWRGGAHLAPSFDTMGWLFRDLQDAPRLGGLFAQGETKEVRHFDRFAVVGDNFLEDCEAVITAGLRTTSAELERLGLCGAVCAARFSMRARGTMRSASSRRSRHGRRRASMQGTSIGLKARFASGWSGARGLRTAKLPGCGSATRSSAHMWTRFLLSMNCY
jgi:Asp-tRNA(Asn)/Glu-tRNA(Gln) amidotransferase A subunit family amidase